MQVTSLDSLIESEKGREDVLKEYLLSFRCEVNKDVESFLHNKAIDNEKRSITRTSLVVDDQNNSEIIGFFSLMVKPFLFTNVSGTTRQKLTGNKKAPIFNTILIAQLGRADFYKGKVAGSLILDIALEHCKLINKLAAIRIVSVEYEENEQLSSFYENNGFKVIQKNENGLAMSYIRV